MLLLPRRGFFTPCRWSWFLSPMTGIIRLLHLISGYFRVRYDHLLLRIWPYWKRCCIRSISCGCRRLIQITNLLIWAVVRYSLRLSLALKLFVPVSQPFQIPVEVASLAESVLVVCLLGRLCRLHKQLDRLQELHELGVLVELPDWGRRRASPRRTLTRSGRNCLVRRWDVLARGRLRFLCSRGRPVRDYLWLPVIVIILISCV